MNQCVMCESEIKTNQAVWLATDSLFANNRWTEHLNSDMFCSIECMSECLEVGETYEGKVKNIVAFGAFLEILPGIDALLHISEIDHKRVEKVDDYMKPGDVMEVKVIGKDPKNGKLKISRKALIEKFPPSNE